MRLPTLLLGALVGPALVLPVLLAACIREADLRDEPDAEAIDTPQDLDAGEVPVLDSGLGTDAFAACAEREQGDCVGTNDFLCGFGTWVNKLAAACQVSTGCVTNGFLQVEMAGGCAVSIAMDQPNDAMLACLLAELGTKQCPCDEASASYFFGQSNTGTCPP
jgi:hypothetical protein